MGKNKRVGVGLIWIFSLLFVLGTAILTVVLFLYTGESESKGTDNSYDSYYGMIVPDTDSSFWQSIFLGAEAEAKSQGAYLELLGDNLSTEYSRTELLAIAIASSMDGIIIVADETEQMKNLIDMASESGIPVVTLYTDSSDSYRCSFVGLSSYNLGKEYGNQVIRILKNRQIADRPVRIDVLVSSHSQDSGQNILVSGIRDTISRAYVDNKRLSADAFDLRLVPIDDTNDLSVEESIRNLLISSNPEAPDIIVCLNEIETTMAYQTVVDYNRVGDISILGYYDSPSILKGISRNVIHSTISIDTAQMGQACVRALNEFRELGNTSQYFTADISLVDKTNVNDYLSKEVEQ